MTEDSFLHSSDSVRSGCDLPHARRVKLDEPLQLERGGRLEEVSVAYETYGTLSPARDNAVLICHAISGDSHVARHDADDAPGWWDIMVGPDRPIDTNRFFVICPNVLGGCRGTTGPNSPNPRTGRPYGSDFPVVTVGDMVEVHRRLLSHLGIERLHAVVGGSLGGHQVLCWATRFADRLDGAVAVATSPRLTSQALAFDVVGRNAILRDPNFHAGQYYDRPSGPDVGLAIARMIGHITYLSREAMHEKFEADRLRPRDVPTGFEKKFSVGSYLGYQGDKFVERFDANSYIVLSTAMDLFDLGGTHQELADALGRSRCRWLVLSFTSDWLFPPDQSRQIVNALVARDRPVSYCNIRSNCGHDAFLLADDLGRYGELIRAFLLDLGGGSSSGAPRRETSGETPACFERRSGREEQDQSPHERSSGNQTVSIFEPRRLDYDRILELIPRGASVLDLGCGSGGLLSMLRARGHERLVGVELDEWEILACVRRGLDVIYGDLNRGLGRVGSPTDFPGRPGHHAPGTRAPAGTRTPGVSACIGRAGEPALPEGGTLASFADQQFDVVVLSQTLQAVRDVQGLLRDMLRVGRSAVISFPNFAYHKLRDVLVREGRAPETSGLLRYRWYNTPNIRFLSIADFQDLCREEGVSIHRLIALDTERNTEIREDPNLNADLAIFLISNGV